MLGIPVLGRFLRWRHARLALQIPMGLAALVLVLHGLFGPRLAPKNLATLLVWVHWRGALVLALLVLGNVFCMGCPLLLPRQLARRFFAPTRRLPRRLRKKWLGGALLVLVLFLYEWLDLWSWPAATAWMILAYFAVALVVDAAFAGAPFCKWVCPIGQFNFVASTLSPVEVRARDLSTCDACVTKDCIKGRRAPALDASALESPRVVQRGCELGLFLPQKVGNLDCTFCLDCVHACPEGNVEIAARLPAAELVDDSVRSGVGRLTRRPDLAAFVALFTFGALLNAFAMVSPVYALQRWIADSMGTESEFIVLAILFGVGLGLLPIALIGAAAASACALAAARTGANVRAAFAPHAVAFTYSLAPLGFGVWLAHYCFHFLTGLWTFVPVTQLALQRLGVDAFGKPRWGLGGLHDAQVWPIEIGFIALGAIASLAVTWRLAERDAPRARWQLFAPWALLQASLAVAALWLLSQPMEMRGTFL